MPAFLLPTNLRKADILLGTEYQYQKQVQVIPLTPEGHTEMSKECAGGKTVREDTLGRQERGCVS